MKLDINKYHEIAMSELVAIGKEGRENLFQLLSDLQSVIGEGNELHPDFMDTLFDAVEELGWDMDDFIKEWVGRG